MKTYVLRNLRDEPRDYVLRDGSSVYLSARGRNSGTALISEDEISEVLKLAERKGLIRLEEVGG